MYNCKMGRTPNYLNLLLKEANPKRPGFRSESQLNYEVPFCELTSYAEMSFSFQDPKCWNELPDLLKRLKTIEGFKRDLKSDLFKQF